MTTIFSKFNTDSEHIENSPFLIFFKFLKFLMKTRLFYGKIQIVFLPPKNFCVFYLLYCQAITRFAHVVKMALVWFFFYRIIREVGHSLRIPIYVFGPETHMTAIVGMALGKRPIPNETEQEFATANFLLPGGQVCRNVFKPMIGV